VVSFKNLMIWNLVSIFHRVFINGFLRFSKEVMAMSKNKIRSILRRVIPLEDYEIEYFKHLFYKSVISERWTRK